MSAIAQLVAGRLSRITVDRIEGWASDVPEWFDGVVQLPMLRVARVRPGARRIAWILAERDAELMLALELSPWPDATPIAGEAVHINEGTTGQHPASPAHLQELSPTPHIPPANAPHHPADGVCSPAPSAGSSSGSMPDPAPALAPGGLRCQPIPSSR